MKTQTQTKNNKTKTLKRRKFTSFRPMLLSRHPSHSILRAKNKTLPLLPTQSVIRLGSSTELPDTVVKGGRRIEINSVQAIKNSASKLRMKQCFTEASVKTARWFVKYDSIGGRGWIEKGVALGEADRSISDLPFPIIAKSHFGSRGVGNTKLDDQAALEAWMRGKDLNSYIFEQFIKMTREYRLHVTEDGCFYTCRKLVKNDAPEGTWQRHDDVCTWVLESNPSFKKPLNWNAIVEDCIKAQKALGLDICAFDVMVQGSKDGIERQNPEWNICESCSAPSFGDVTSEKYIEVIPQLIMKKYENIRSK